MSRRGFALSAMLLCSLNASAHDTVNVMIALGIVFALPIIPVVVLAWPRWIWMLVGVPVVWTVGYLLLEHEVRVMRALNMSLRSGVLTMWWFLLLWVIALYRAIAWFMRKRNSAVEPST